MRTQEKLNADCGLSSDSIVMREGQSRKGLLTEEEKRERMNVKKALY